MLSIESFYNKVYDLVNNVLSNKNLIKDLYIVVSGYFKIDQILSSDLISFMGVTIENEKLKLFYNPIAVDELSEENFAFIFMHELMHVVLNHVGRYKSVQEKYESSIFLEQVKSIYPLIVDLYVNEFLKQFSVKYKEILNPPEFGIFKEDFIDILKKQFPDDKNIEHLVHELEYNCANVLNSMTEEKLLDLIIDTLSKDSDSVGNDYNFENKQVDGYEIISVALHNGKSSELMMPENISMEELHEMSHTISSEILLINGSNLVLDASEGKFQGNLWADILNRQISKIIEKKLSWKQLLRDFIKHFKQSDHRSWSQPLKQLRRKVYFRGHDQKQSADYIPLLMIDSSGSIDNEELEEFFSVLKSGFQVFENLYIMVHDVNAILWKNILPKDLYRKFSRNIFDEVFLKVNKIEFRRIEKQIDKLLFSDAGTSHLEPISNHIKFINENVSGIFMLTDGYSDIEELEQSNILKVPCVVVLSSKNDHKFLKLNKFKQIIINE